MVCVKYILRSILIICLAGLFLFFSCSCSSYQKPEPSDSDLVEFQPPENEPSEPETPENPVPSDDPKETPSDDQNEPSSELPSDNSSSEENEEKKTPLFNLSQIVDYISELPPSALGLSGNSMSEYRFYPGEGILHVGEGAFRQFIVYRIDGKTGSNVFVQAYLIDMTTRQLYKLDIKTNNIEKLSSVPEA